MREGKAMKDPKAKLNDIYFNIIKHIDEHTPAVDIQRVYLGTSIDKGFYTFVFDFGAGGIEIEFYHDELADTDIYTTIFKRFYSQYRNSSYGPIQYEYEEAHELKEFLKLFPEPILTYYHTGSYKLKKGDKLLYKQYISEVLYIDEDGDIELKVGDTSNSYEPSQLSGYDIIYISPKPKKVKEVYDPTLRTEWVGTWIPDTSHNIPVGVLAGEELFCKNPKHHTVIIKEESIKEASKRFREQCKKLGLIK